MYYINIEMSDFLSKNVFDQKKYLQFTSSEVLLGLIDVARKTVT